MGAASQRLDQDQRIALPVVEALTLVGEVFDRAGDTDAEQDLIVGIIHDELAPRLIGRSATDPEGAWREPQEIGLTERQLHDLIDNLRSHAGVED